MSKADLNRRFGQALRARRNAIGLSQKQLAERIGVERTSITMIENGAQAVSLPTLVELSNALDVSAAELVESVEPTQRALAHMQSRHGQRALQFLREFGGDKDNA